MHCNYKPTRPSASAIAFAILLFWVVGHAGAAETALLAGDPANGKKLHAAHCLECHDPKIYTRADRRVNSLSALIRQVNACSKLPKPPLTAAQADDLTAYLNETYYKFK